MQLNLIFAVQYKLYLNKDKNTDGECTERLRKEVISTVRETHLISSKHRDYKTRRKSLLCTRKYGTTNHSCSYKNV